MARAAPAPAVFLASQRLSLWTIRGGGALMFLAALLISADVLLRKLASVTLGGADELAGYAMAIACAWSFSYVLLNRGNVRVDALYQHLPRPATIALDLLAVLALGVLAAVFAWYGHEVVNTSWSLASRSNSALKVPLWIPQGLWWLGLLQFLLTAAILLWRALALLAGGHGNELKALLGARSIEEDAAAEADHARRHEGELLKEEGA
ncbi:MAG: TRAP transporter small permease [Rhodocyclales bacterium]|nr:TRAP transporter small permease [Rhodocyclales bacterium]